MKLNADSLPGHLTRDLKSAYLISGDEPLLAAEATDAIRHRARESGYTERQVFFVERGFDWNALRNESQSLSLFAERRVIDVRMPGGKPGDGAELLQSLVENPAPDQLLLVSCGRLERQTLQSGWVKAFEQQGAWIQIWPIDLARLPDWIAARMRARGLVAEPGAAELLAERAEGNLLAAQQEIDKLALLVKPGAVDAAALSQVVADSARFDAFQLGDAALRGDARRALRVLDGLRGEGVEPTLVLWVLSRELRALWQHLSQERSGRSPPAWQRPNPALLAAAQRARNLNISELVSLAVRADRTIKGRQMGDPWDALAMLVAQLAGVRTLADAA
ncbi:MAG TPA: DNA polymerase III subunit delta [Steroidobacteraceae bacterium]|nr:DNA polymerase III subunit delta [Steroidobacteraceae bacterium]